LEIVILPEVIQKTAIWLLATLALCSPGTVVTNQTREPIGACYEVWSIQIASDGVRQTVSRLVYRPAANFSEPIQACSEPDSEISTAASRLYFGSLYNRPPPALLSFS
jgi:hypothetical protein